MARGAEVHARILIPAGYSRSHQATALTIGILINDRAWAFASIHHHGRYWDEVVLLDEFFRVDQFQGLVCL